MPILHMGIAEVKLYNGMVGFVGESFNTDACHRQNFRSLEINRLSKRHLDGLGYHGRAISVSQIIGNVGKLIRNILQ